LREFRCDRGREFDNCFHPPPGRFLAAGIDSDTALDGEFAFVRSFLAQNDGKESGFSRPIRPYEANPILAIHLQARIGEQDAFAGMLCACQTESTCSDCKVWR